MVVSATSNPMANLDSPGPRDIDAAMHRALKGAIHRSGKSRQQIVDELSAQFGVNISVHILNNWTADSKPERRIPADVIPAICAVLGSDALLNILEDPQRWEALRLGRAVGAWLDRKYGRKESF